MDLGQVPLPARHSPNDRTPWEIVPSMPACLAYPAATRPIPLSSLAVCNAKSYSCRCTVTVGAEETGCSRPVLAKDTVPCREFDLEYLIFSRSIQAPNQAGCCLQDRWHAAAVQCFLISGLVGKPAAHRTGDVCRFTSTRSPLTPSSLKLQVPTASIDQYLIVGAIASLRAELPGVSD